MFVMIKKYLNSKQMFHLFGLKHAIDFCPNILKCSCKAMYLLLLEHVLPLGINAPVSEICLMGEAQCETVFEKS